jgi:hypothetical protein
MIAKLFKLSTDLVLSLIFLSIIGTSFIATLSLSPDALELFSVDSNVLGVSSDQKYLKVKLDILQNTNSEIFNIEDISTKNNYVYRVTSNARTNSKISDKVLTIVNKSEQIEQVRIQIKTSDQNLKLANFGIEVEELEQLLSTTDYKTSNSIILNIGPNQTLDLKTFIEYKEFVNFPLEFDLEVTNL